MYHTKRVALILPALNEEQLIIPTIERVPEIVDKIFVINDGSTDKTVELVLQKQKADPRIELVNHPRNLGLGQAVITGYLAAAAAGYEYIVVAGADNQMPLELIPALLDPLVERRADYAKGNRFARREGDFARMPKIRFLANTLLSFITKIASGYYQIYDVVDGFTAITREAVAGIDWSRAWKYYGYPMDFLIRLNTAGFKVIDVPRPAIYLPGVRQSQIKGLRYAFKVSPMIVRGFFRRLWQKYFIHNFHPLFFFYLAGVTLFPLGVLYSIYLVINKLTIDTVTGGKAVFAALLLIFGFQSLLFAMWFDMEEGK